MKNTLDTVQIDNCNLNMGLGRKPASRIQLTALKEWRPYRIERPYHIGLVTTGYTMRILDNRAIKVSNQLVLMLVLRDILILWQRLTCLAASLNQVTIRSHYHRQIVTITQIKAIPEINDHAHHARCV